MTQKFEYEARQWLSESVDNVIYDRSNDPKHGPALVEDLYRAGAVKVEVGGLKEFSNEADTLFVTLPEDRGSALEVVLLLAWQKGDEVDLVEGKPDVVRIWWN